MLDIPATAWQSDAARIEFDGIADGILRYTVRSDYQYGETTIRVLVPEGGAKPQRIVYLLPAEEGESAEYGCGLAETRRLGVQQRFNALIVCPSYSQLPWYADHDSDPNIRQESYLLRVVLPFVETMFPVEQPQRLLLGFSKSGWGAFSLLLRYPDEFAKAVAFDSALAMTGFGRQSMEAVFGTLKNFERYCLSTQLKRNSSKLKDFPRFALIGFDYFRNHHREMHELMCVLQVPHVWRDGPQRGHNWSSGWLDEAFEFLFED